jgi:hypothetical protein
MIFELTNEQRKYLGLIPIESNWEVVKLNDMYLYFDGDIIRKKITVSEESYFEQELEEKTAENRTILLPKTSKGKPKKLNFTATQSFRPFGVYLSFSNDYMGMPTTPPKPPIIPKASLKKAISKRSKNGWLNG